jgi:Protein kinase domain
MGEVYRADDLKLGQAVALKFLPKALSNDPVRRERFFAEVRITRQLSHPNICRVYDIAEFDGQHFLSMEFIDGEDLASLIRRIGYLSNEKALDIARQLMAGLSTAHEKGVLHRDLKPSNIMIDGHGRVRITDFGIAVAMEDETQAAEMSGTPAYMAPEQLAGKGASVRSDIYSLGLILYELCSGKRAFTATTIAELREQKERHTPRAPSDTRSGVDPILERLITRCIDRDPRGRPASVSQLAASLPGGDPLAAAIAAGQTPSPEMVAASGLKEGLRPAVGVALLAIIVVGLLIVAASGSRDRVFMRVPSGNPEVLAEKGREFLRNAGYTNAGVDRASGYTFIFSLVDLSSELGTDKAREQWDKVEAESLRFWYRESPEPLTHWRDDNYVAPGDPPMFAAGGVRIQMTADARLRELIVTPTRGDSVDRSAESIWSSLFSEAGLNETDFTRSATDSNPFFYGDTRAAWDETMPQAPEIRMRIEAAAYQGKPVYFRVMWPWSRTDARFSHLFLVEVN